MRFTPQFLDDLKVRLPVSEVVGRRVKLQKAGREWKGLSPFNKEKTASFFVNDQKQAWFDFSSGKNGSIFDFVMLTEGVAFPEAVERLANMAGMPLPKYSREEEARDEKRKTLHDVMELAAKFFETTLAGRLGAKARGYLADRSLDSSIQLKFRLGYAPAERFALKEHLGGQGVSVEDMIETGLLISGDDIPVPYDRFRDRVMFPIADFRGRIVGFGGRALAADAPAKYLNSPETPLFHKGANLYNGAAARQAAHDGAPLIVVEGYVDVIQMVGAGFLQTVAPLGTALTERQLQILWRMADEPILCFDGDSAGVRAAHRAVDLALPLLEPGKSLRFALLPEKQDPDDLIRASGAEAMGQVIAAARPLVDMIWGRETGAGVFDTPERRAALEARLREIARAIGDESVRRHYGQAFAERVAAFFPPPQRASGEWRAANRRGGRDSSSSTRYPPLAIRSSSIPVSDRLRRSQLLGKHAAIPFREVVLAMTMVGHPALLARHMDDFTHLEFGNADLDRLRGAVIDIVAHGHDDDGELDATTLRESLAGRGLGGLVERLAGQVATMGYWPAGSAAADRDAEEGWLQALTLHRRQGTLHKELREAEAALAGEASEANLARLVDIQNQLARSEGTEALIEGFGASSGRQARVF
jgi:DNA primase